MTKQRPKWYWLNGRLHHPTEANISLSVSEAYRAQKNNKDIAKACEGVLKECTEKNDANLSAVTEKLRKEEAAK